MVRRTYSSVLLLGAGVAIAACSDDKPARSEAVAEETTTGGAAGAKTTSTSTSGGNTSNTVATNSSTVTASSTSSTSGGSGGMAGASQCDSGDEACAGGAPPECEDCGSSALGAACESGPQCQSGVCVNSVCAECDPGALDCLGSVTRECSSVGRWLRGAACSGATPRCYQGECVACSEGETRPCADCSGIEVCANQAWGACQSSLPPSCADTPDCSGESCCTAELVSAGSFYFGPLLSYSASVSDFCLDKYEVTVGRFREFLAAYDSWQPAPDAGAHQLGAPSGWQSEWTKGSALPSDTQAFAAALACGEHPTWQDTPGAAELENLPQNCLSWHEAFAFCIWDGGRLATEAEWEYAAAGGEEERTYPWGEALADNTLAVFDCCADGDCSSCSGSDILPVGMRPTGNARFGQSDLAGNVYEWVLDAFAAIDFRPWPCIDCAVTPSGSSRVQRGGGYSGDSLSLAATGRPVAPATTRSDALGVRCVRKR